MIKLGNNFYHIIQKLSINYSPGHPEEGMNFLRRAQVMYHHRPDAVKEVCEERCENNYTMTMLPLRKQTSVMVLVSSTPLGG